MVRVVGEYETIPWNIRGKSGTKVIKYFILKQEKENMTIANKVVLIYFFFGHGLEMLLEVGFLVLI